MKQVRNIAVVVGLVLFFVAVFWVMDAYNITYPAFMGPT